MKGQAVRKARIQAAATGQPVAIERHRVTVLPTGQVVEMGERVDGMVHIGTVAVPVADRATGGAVSRFAALVESGLSEDEALALLMSRAAPTARPPEPLGPDPDVVAERARRLQHYVAPPANETFAVVLPTRIADYVRRSAQSWSLSRGGERITPERAIELIVRRAKQLDQADAVATAPNSKTGPASSFNPAAQTWKP